MKIQTSNINFGIYKSTRKTYYGFVNSGVYKDMNIDIYHAFNADKTLKHKLYYLTDNFGKWIKSKLKFFKDDKCYYIAKSEAK